VSALLRSSAIDRTWTSLSSLTPSPICPIPLSQEKQGGPSLESPAQAEQCREIPISDDILMARIQAGDNEALALLFGRYRRLVRAVSFRIVKDDAEAEDLVQDLFLFIRRRCEVFDNSKSCARSWIVQMTYHRAIERRRYLATRQFYAHTEVEGRGHQVVGKPTTESDYSAEAVFGRNGLEKVLEDLSEDQRETLRLHFFEGYTLAEISEKLGQPRGNVRHHYYRGLDRLRKEMLGSTVRVAERYGK
jgi:RNA polymerase sigma-70 factor (ECF subfamily)